MHLCLCKRVSIASFFYSSWGFIQKIKTIKSYQWIGVLSCTFCCPSHTIRRVVVICTFLPISYGYGNRIFLNTRDNEYRKGNCSVIDGYFNHRLLRSYLVSIRLTLVISHIQPQHYFGHCRAHDGVIVPGNFCNRVR